MRRSLSFPVSHVYKNVYCRNFPSTTLIRFSSSSESTKDGSKIQQESPANSSNNKEIKTSSTIKNKDDIENPKVADWIKEIQEGESRPQIKYRKQNYSGPFSRTIGILSDDVKFFFGGIYGTSKDLWNRFCAIEIKYKDDRPEFVKRWMASKASKDKEPNSVEKDPKSAEPPETVTKEPAKKTIDTDVDKSVSDDKVAAETSKPSRIGKYLDKYRKENDQIWPGHCDVLIIGGGAIGSSIAYHLTKEARDGLRVVVVDKDLTVSALVNKYIANTKY